MAAYSLPTLHAGACGGIVRFARHPQDRFDMLTYALLLLAAAALGGFVLASNVLRGRLAPWVVSVGHGLIGTSGVVLLGWIVLQGASTSRAAVALGLLVVAALGGLTLATMHLRGALAARTIVYAHAFVAILGVLVLFSAVLA